MKEHTLVKFWKEAIENQDDTNLQESALSLQRKAEIGVSDRKNTYLDAESNLRKIKISSKDKPNFDSIVDARLQLKIAKTKYEESLILYKEMFGTEPMLLEFKTETVEAEVAPKDTA